MRGSPGFHGFKHLSMHIYTKYFKFNLEVEWAFTICRIQCQRPLFACATGAAAVMWADGNLQPRSPKRGNLHLRFKDRLQELKIGYTKLNADECNVNILLSPSKCHSDLFECTLVASLARFVGSSS